MNVLILTESLPYPEDSGGKIVSFRLLEHLAKDHSIFLCTFVYQKDKKYIQKLCNILGLKQIYTIEHFLIFSNNFKLEKPAMLNSILNSNPYNVTKFFSKKMKEIVHKLLKKHKFDSIWIDHINMHQYLPPNYNGQTNLVVHNIETVLYFRHALYAHKWRWKIFFAIEFIKFFFYERIYFKRFSTIYTLSQTDADYAKRLFSPPSDKNKLERQIKLLSYKFFIPKIKHVQRNNSKNVILFVGNIVWYPNYQGILWFITRIFPQIFAKMPLCQLVVVGDVPDHLRNETYKNVTFTGHVKNIQSYYEEASVFIVPLFIGSGIRIKILEALSYKIPVVSTSTGCEGIPQSLKRKIIIANSPEEFKSEILKILK